MDKAFGFRELFTEQLALRKLKVGDADALFALRTNHEVNRYLDRPETTDINQVHDFINKINKSVDSGESFYWAITLPGDDKLIGTICFYNLSDDKTEVEIGYELYPYFQGKGLMQEAISEVIAFGFNDLGFKTITAFPAKNNERSITLLEKNNFKIDHELTEKNKNNEEFDNLLCYSLFNEANK